MVYSIYNTVVPLLHITVIYHIILQRCVLLRTRYMIIDVSHMGPYLSEFLHQSNQQRRTGKSAQTEQRKQQTEYE